MDNALRKFVEDWSMKESVLGILLCGSYAVGLGNDKSDIDIRIITDTNQKKSFKGLSTIDGYSFSFLGRNKMNIIKKFNVDYFNNSKIESRNFCLGNILFDKDDTVAELKSIALLYIEIPFLRKMSIDDLKDKMYTLHSLYSYLIELDSNSPFFNYNYILFMRMGLIYYSKILGVELDYDTKLDRMLNDDDYIREYGFNTFPDKVFINIWQKALLPNSINTNSVKTVYDYLRSKIYSIDENEFIMYWFDR